jgi:hypothetical protein
MYKVEMAYGGILPETLVKFEFGHGPMIFDNYPP